jgi:hypothetical protein
MWFVSRMGIAHPEQLVPQCGCSDITPLCCEHPILDLPSWKQHRKAILPLGTTQCAALDMFDLATLLTQLSTCWWSFHTTWFSKQIKWIENSKIERCFSTQWNQIHAPPPKVSQSDNTGNQSDPDTNKATFYYYPQDSEEMKNLTEMECEMNGFLPMHQERWSSSMVEVELYDFFHASCSIQFQTSHSALLLFFTPSTYCSSMQFHNCTHHSPRAYWGHVWHTGCMVMHVTEKMTASCAPVATSKLYSLAGDILLL